MTTFVIIRNTDKRHLCKDGKLRHMPLFGSTGACTKVYTKAGHANRRAVTLQRRGNDVSVLTIPEKHTFNLHGQVIKLNY